MRFALMFLLLAFTAPAIAAKTRVRSHVTKSGKYVPAHNRTKADGRKSNNWSTKGNTNPYTGKRGSK